MSGLATIQLKTLYDEYKDFSLRPSVVLQKISERSFNVWDHDIYFTALYAVFDLAASMVNVGLRRGGTTDSIPGPGPTGRPPVSHGNAHRDV